MQATPRGEPAGIGSLEPPPATPDGPRRVAGYRLLMRLEAPAGELHYAADDAGAEVLLELHAIGARRASRGRTLDRLAARPCPELPAVLAWGVEREQLWIALELVEGRDLSSIVATRRPARLTAAEALHVIGRCARALAALHALGRVHGALGGREVLLGHGGAVRLTTLGGALARQPPPPPSELAAPEERPGAPATQAGDVHRLALLAAELLGGGAAQHAADDCADPPAPAGAQPNHPLATFELCDETLPLDRLRLLRRAAAERPEERPTAQELAEAFAAELDDPLALASLRRAALQAAPGAAPGPLLRGDRLGAYLVEDELGRGGMGVVYRARHELLDQCVALKVLMPGLLASDTVRARFLREARLGAALAHPCIVPVLDAGTARGLDYLAMELVDGEPLQAALARRGRDERVRLFVALCDGVQHAHLRGVVHRDLKPENVLVQPDGTPRILDFGVARRIDAGAGTLTTSGAWLGTALYMAPEQVVDPQAVDVRSDVYALGTMLYEALAGVAPFQGGLFEVLQRKQQEDAPPLRERRRTAPDAGGCAVPCELEAVCARALERDPAARYQSALELRRDLERVLAGEPVSALRLSPLRRARRWMRRRRRALAAGAFAAALALGSLGVEAALEASRRRALLAQVDALAQAAAQALERRAPGEAAARLELARELLEGEPAVAAGEPLAGARLGAWAEAARGAQARLRVDALLERGAAALEAARALEPASAWPEPGGPDLRAPDERARREQLQQARSLLEEAQRLAPRRADVRDALARTYAQLGRLEELEAQRRTLEERQRAAAEHVTAARRHLASGALDEARGAFERALGLDGSSLGAREGLREVERGLLARAQRERAERALAALHAARAALARGAPAEARAYTEQARAVVDALDAPGVWLEVWREAAEHVAASDRHERLGRAERALRNAEAALREARAAFVAGEPASTVRAAYFAALEHVATAAELAPSHGGAGEALEEVGAELATVLIHSGQAALAAALRHALALPDGPVALPRDQHLEVVEVDRVTAARALGGELELSPSRALAALRQRIRAEAPSRRLRVEVRTDVARTDAGARLLLRALVLRAEDRTAGTIGPPRELPVDPPRERRVQLEPDGRRRVAPWEESVNLDAAALEARVVAAARELLGLR